MTELVFILDRSGSMAGLEADTIGGFNSMIARQKQEAGEALVSTVLFANDSTVIHDRLPLSEVPPLTEKRSISPAAARRCWMPWAAPSITSATSTSTPAGRMCRRRRCSSSPPTATKTPAAATITSECRMVKRQKERYGWEFLFLGANIDAAKEAAHFGIGADRSVNYKCDEAGTALNYEVISEAVCSVRAARPLSADWKRRIDEDVQKRGR